MDPRQIGGLQTRTPENAKGKIASIGIQLTAIAKDIETI
jgi:hypothetical protein